MPNYVKNIVKMTGISSFPLFSKLGDFDFNKLIPMPKSLNIGSGFIETLAMEALARNQGIQVSLNRQPMSDKKYLEAIDRFHETEQHLCQLGIQYLRNEIRYGARTWYDWCIKHWGTKWNAMNSKKIATDMLCFDTAWSAPEPVIAQLAKMYPKTEIEHWWADENLGCNSGYTKYEGGEEKEIVYHENNSYEAFATYVFCWGESLCLCMTDGLWHMRDCENCHGCD